MHYVIGDVHGCYDEMIALIKKIENMDAEARFIFVGDFIDRGPQVDQVLGWCMNNITPEGKYQAVRGNHEQMVLEWYEEWLEWWNETDAPMDWCRMPETSYDFSKWADAMDILNPDELQPYMDLFSSLPYDKLLEIESKWGKKVSFRIVHAYYEYGDVTEEVQHESNLWKRTECGNHMSDEIIVHGHTPTVNYDYGPGQNQDVKPGLICYRQNDINVDGGCIYAEEIPMFPISLCAIRLEDLEEIYQHSVEESFMKRVGNGVKEACQKERFERYVSNCMSLKGICREMMLDNMGRPL